MNSDCFPFFNFNYLLCTNYLAEKSILMAGANRRNGPWDREWDFIACITHSVGLRPYFEYSLAVDKTLWIQCISVMWHRYWRMPFWFMKFLGHVQKSICLCQSVSKWLMVTERPNSMDVMWEREWSHGNCSLQPSDSKINSSPPKTPRKVKASRNLCNCLCLPFERHSEDSNTMRKVAKQRLSENIFLILGHFLTGFCRGVSKIKHLWTKHV